MDTSFLAPGPIIWVQVIAFALFVVTFPKGVD